MASFYIELVFDHKGSGGCFSLSCKVLTVLINWLSLLFCLDLPITGNQARG